MLTAHQYDLISLVLNVFMHYDRYCSVCLYAGVLIKIILQYNACQFPGGN